MQEVFPVQSLLEPDADDCFQQLASCPEQAASIFASRFPDDVIVGNPRALFFGNNGGSGSHGALGSAAKSTVEARQMP